MEGVRGHVTKRTLASRSHAYSEKAVISYGYSGD